MEDIRLVNRHRKNKVARIDIELAKAIEEEQRRVFDATGIYPSKTQVQKKIVNEWRRNKYKIKDKENVFPI